MSFKPNLESSVVPGRSRGTQWFSFSTCHFYVGPLLWKGIGVMVCKKSAYPNCSGALTKCYGRLATVPEDLTTAPEHLPTAPEHLLTAPEHFRNCSGALIRNTFETAPEHF